MIRFFQQLSIMVLATLLLNGCAVYPPSAEQQTTDLSSAGFLSLFMNQSTAETQIQVLFTNIELYAEPLWFPLQASADHGIPANAQTLLAAAALGSNSYTRIRFKLTITDAENKPLREEQTELRLPQPLVIKAGSSQCLFINSQLSLQTLDQPLQQQLTLWIQQPPLVDEILYILCPEIQTLYLAKLAPLQIVAAYGVGEDIADMALDKRKKILYLLDRRHRLIKKFDTISQSLTDRISLPLTDQPEYLGLSRDGQTLYVSDPSNQKILQLDSRSGNLLQQQTTRYPPGKIHPFSFQQQQYLAILYPRDQQLQVLSAETMKSLYTINAGLQPVDLVFSDENLFVSDSFSRQVLKITPLSGSIMMRITTAYPPGKLINDPVNRNLLIGFCKKHEIAFLPFGQQLVARRVKTAGCPADLAVAQQRRLLFVALGKQQQIKIFDLPSEKLLGSLELATQPGTIAYQEP